MSICMWMMRMMMGMMMMSRRKMGGVEVIRVWIDSIDFLIYFRMIILI